MRSVSPNVNAPDPNLTRRKLTDAELAQHAQVTQAYVDAAVAAFNQYAPAEAKGLLDAKPEERND